MDTECPCHTIIFSFLSMKDMLALRLVSKYMREVASLDVVWVDRLKVLWDNKVRTNAYDVAMAVIEKFRGNDAVLEPSHDLTFNCFNVYMFSLRDSFRQHITNEELVKFDWYFRFKEATGSEWTSFDPWWQIPDENDLELVRLAKTCPRRNSFLSDGTIIQHSDMLQYLDPGKTDPRVFLSTRVKRSWKFVNDSLDFVPRGDGSYVKVTVQGKEVPTFVVRRSPTNNWGFILESCWCVYTSFPMPRRGECPSLEDEAFVIKNKDQWREAFLYNHGTGSLPHGIDEFDVQEFDSKLDVPYNPRSCLVSVFERLPSDDEGDVAPKYVLRNDLSESEYDESSVDFDCANTVGSNDYMLHNDNT